LIDNSGADVQAGLLAGMRDPVVTFRDRWSSVDIAVDVAE